MADTATASWRIRPAELSDAERLAMLPHASAGASRRGDAWRAWIGDAATRTLIAQSANGALQGLLDARQAADEAEIIDLWIAPAARRRGLASALLARLAGDLASTGAARLFLEVAVDNVAARALYEKQGFATVARRVAYYSRPGSERVDALVMARPVGSTNGCDSEISGERSSGGRH